MKMAMIALTGYYETYAELGNRMVGPVEAEDRDSFVDSLTESEELHLRMEENVTGLHYGRVKLLDAEDSAYWDGSGAMVVADDEGWALLQKASALQLTGRTLLRTVEELNFLIEAEVRTRIICKRIAEM